MISFNGWRLIPKITVTNWKNERHYHPSLYRSWFGVAKYWGGKIINVNIRHIQFSFDFRSNWLKDMMPKKATK